jgi:hypothetical protein
MLIHQVELDVATEVQKRGRINRTGQVNNPAYTYVVSCIPSEVRKLLMLRRKLRSLDANTTGNVKQSAKASQILDKEGNEIEDMTNKYGWQVLQEYVQMPNKEIFRDLVEKEWYNKNASPEDMFDAYLREIEKLPCEAQEKFYNEMNALYSALKKSLLENDEWDLETNMEDLRASTQNKKVLYSGNDKNEFTKSVFIEDKFVTPKGKPYTKEELMDRMEFLAQKKDYTEFHNELTDEFEDYMALKLKELRESYGQPDTSSVETQEEKDQIIEEHETMVNEAVNKLEQKLNEVKYPLRHFKPNKIVYVPVDTDALSGGAFDEKGDRISVMAKVGKFVGYKINHKSDNKWSPMNIELEFATTSNVKPHLRISLTKQYRGILNWIMDIKAHEISSLEVAEVNNWVIKKKSDRDKMRVLTGELFRGLEMATKLYGEDINYQRKSRLIKYSNSAGGVEAGIKMWLQQWKPLNESASPTFTPINSDGYKDMLKGLRDNLRVWWSSNNEFIVKDGSRYRIYFCTGKDLIKGGSERKTAQKEYISDYSDEKKLQLLEKSIGVPYKEERISLEMFSKGADEWVRGMKFFYFDLKEDKFFELMDIMFRDYKILEDLKDASKGFVLEGQEDPLSKGEADTSGEKEGVYDYYLMTSFDENAVPENYIANSYKQVPEADYGMISLKFPLDLFQCGIYKVVPANITEARAMRNILNAIQDDKQKLDYIDKVKAYGNDYQGIVELTQQVTGVHPIYAIGNVKPKFAGKLIAENIDKPLPKPEEDKTDIVVSEFEKSELVSISWDSVQDFMIKFKSI